MNKTKIIKKTAIIIFVTLSILLFLQTIQRVRLLIPRGGFFTYSSPPIIMFLSFVLHVGIAILCFLLLRTIINNETPFKKKTVTLLKIIAFLFICIDIQGAIGTIYQNFQLRSNPAPTYIICEYTGTTVIHATPTTIWFGGFAVIAGLIIYLIALVLKYGISLQTQVDETL